MENRDILWLLPYQQLVLEQLPVPKEYLKKNIISWIHQPIFYVNFTHHISEEPSAPKRGHNNRRSMYR